MIKFDKDWRPATVAVPVYCTVYLMDTYLYLLTVLVTVFLVQITLLYLLQWSGVLADSLRLEYRHIYRYPTIVVGVPHMIIVISIWCSMEWLTLGSIRYSPYIPDLESLLNSDDRKL